MKPFIFFVATVFSILFLFYVYRDEKGSSRPEESLKIYAPTSFNGTYGPGPDLKAMFELKTGQKVVLLDMNDPGLVFQKINLDGSQAIGDLVLGLDQYDIARFSDATTWKPVSRRLGYELPISIKDLETHEFFIPYDWSAISVVTRTDFNVSLRHLDDLLKPEVKGLISYQDPRTSSPGLQLLLWIAHTKSEVEAIQYLKALNHNAHSFSANWSTAYGLFRNKDSKAVLSYITSPAYHLIEDKDASYKAIEFSEGHPLQIEFAGILGSCKNCEAAYQFLDFIQTPEAQKIIMSKNYMMPVNKQVIDGTAFDSVRLFKTLPFRISSKDEINKWLNIWSMIRSDEEDID